MAEDRGRDGEGGRERREPRLRDIARRFLVEPEEGQHEDRGRMDAREMLGAVLETGDKAKTEVVRMVAREVRSYLEALELGEDIRDLLTNYSLEVHASFHLKPLDGGKGDEEEDGGRRERGRRGRRKHTKPEEPAEDEG